MRIEQLLHRRTDLSTFLVHLTRDRDDLTAKERLKDILRSRALHANGEFGQAVSILDGDAARSDQKCVCFTETPLEHISLLTESIEGRQYAFAPYGVAITRKQGRRSGVNPVWYLDITPGRDWLTKDVDALIRWALANPEVPEAQRIFRLTPFIEQMGSGRRRDGGGYRKEFWWEREWRHVGNLRLPERLIVVAPSIDFDDLRAAAGECEMRLSPVFIDATWSLEQMIGHVAGLAESDLDRCNRSQLRYPPAHDGPAEEAPAWPDPRGSPHPQGRREDFALRSSFGPAAPREG